MSDFLALIQKEFYAEIIEVGDAAMLHPQCERRVVLRESELLRLIQEYSVTVEVSTGGET
jgi:hypothetical protein